MTWTSTFMWETANNLLNKNWGVSLFLLETFYPLFLSTEYVTRTVGSAVSTKVSRHAIIDSLYVASVFGWERELCLLEMMITVRASPVSEFLPYRYTRITVPWDVIFAGTHLGWNKSHPPMRK